MFKQMIHWCNYKNFPWKIANGHFFWQTNCSTGEKDENNNVFWHDRSYFTTI